MRREQQKRQNRTRLIEAALACFSEEGYDRVTVDVITRRAGLAKGTFFNYFRSKADVLLQVGAVQEEWMVEEIARILQADETPVPEAVTRLMVAAATRFPLTRPLLRAMHQAALQTPDVSEAQVRHFAQVGMALIPLCERGQQKGELTRTLSPYDIARHIMQAYSGALLAWSLTPEPETLGELMERTFRYLFDGLRPREKAFEEFAKPAD